jgi:hypothetical protein
VTEQVNRHRCRSRAGSNLPKAFAFMFPPELSLTHAGGGKVSPGGGGGGLCRWGGHHAHRELPAAPTERDPHVRGSRVPERQRQRAGGKLGDSGAPGLYRIGK